MGFNNGSGGSGGAISGLSDVALDNPANNHVLAYDTTTSKWKNSPENDTTTIGAVSGLQTALDSKITGQNGATGLWIGTQAQYDALSTKNPTTLYAITET